MGKVVAIGGGSIAKKVTLPIDNEIVRLSGKKFPHVLFIPTASGDSVEYIDAFRNVYRDILGCKVDVLSLIKQPLAKDVIKEKIENADVIYVGGGNTLRMMKLWRKKGVDRLLSAAFQKDVVLCGVSAGAICWFAYGNSDSRRYSNPTNWKPIRVRGLGILPYTLCPHYHTEKREVGFDEMIKKHNIKEAYALDDGTALVYSDHKSKIMKVNSSARAYNITKTSGKIVKELLT